MYKSPYFAKDYSIEPMTKIFQDDVRKQSSFLIYFFFVEFFNSYEI